MKQFCLTIWTFQHVHIMQIIVHRISILWYVPGKFEKKLQRTIFDKNYINTWNQIFRSVRQLVFMGIKSLEEANKILYDPLSQNKIYWRDSEIWTAMFTVDRSRYFHMLKFNYLRLKLCLLCILYFVCSVWMMDEC